MPQASSAAEPQSRSISLTIDAWASQSTSFDIRRYSKDPASSQRNRPKFTDVAVDDMVVVNDDVTEAVSVVDFVEDSVLLALEVRVVEPEDVWVVDCVVTLQSENSTLPFKTVATAAFSTSILIEHTSGEAKMIAPEGPQLAVPKVCRAALSSATDASRYVASPASSGKNVYSCAYS